MNPPAADEPALSFDNLTAVLNAAPRWRMLRELCIEPSLPVGVLARRTGQTPGMGSKHLAILRRSGIVTVKYGLYTIAPAYRPAPGSFTLALGPCTLHLDKLPP